MKEKKGFFLGLCTGIVLVLLVMEAERFFGIKITPSFTMADKAWEKANVVEKFIDKYYWKTDVSDEKMAEYAAKGIVSALGDKYSAYFTQEEYETASNTVNGEYAGIGITLTAEDKTNKKIITEVQGDKPGAKAGLKTGDEVISVNGTDVTQLSLSDTVDQIRGEEGRESVLGIRRKTDGKEKTFTVTVKAEKIVSQSVSAKLLKGKLGYVRVQTFNNKTSEQFESALKSLDDKGQKGLIIDLRDNGGGALSAALNMLDDLLPAGDLITEENRGEESKSYRSTDERHFDKPIVVLINGGSASASEVFSGTLQDRKAATLVGVKSYGKGIIQTIFSLENSIGGGIKLTTGEYLLPSGRSIHEKGLTPDVVCEYKGTSGELGASDDNQLAKAREVLAEKVAQ